MRIRYFLGGGPVSIFSFSCVIKADTMGSLAGGIMDSSCGAVPTLRGGYRLLYGTTLVAASGRGSLGWIVGCVGVMASKIILLVVTGPPVF